MTLAVDCNFYSEIKIFCLLGSKIESFVLFYLTIIVYWHYCHANALESKKIYDWENSFRSYMHNIPRIYSKL